jgi:hypothetical protein
MNVQLQKIYADEMRMKFKSYNYGKKCINKILTASDYFIYTKHSTLVM